jgi:hypothetical protein
MNCSIPETWATIEERVPEDTIPGAVDKKSSSSDLQTHEVLVETADEEEEVTTAVDTAIHHVDMFTMSNKRGVILRTQPPTTPTVPQVTVLSTRTRKGFIPESMLTSRQEGLSPQSRWQTS